MASPVSNQITLTRSNKFQMAHLNRKWYTQLQHDSLINFLLSNCRKNTELLSREIFLNKSYYIPAPPIFRMPSQISNSRGNLAMDNLAAFICLPQGDRHIPSNIHYNCHTAKCPPKNSKIQWSRTVSQQQSRKQGQDPRKEMLRLKNDLKSCDLYILSIANKQHDTYPHQINKHSYVFHTLTELSQTLQFLLRQE